METIRTAHNLTIEHDPTTWRLLNGNQHSEHPNVQAALVEASPNRITCSPAFSKARHLPDGPLTPSDVARVVVGWAPESQNWHLGLLLAARPDTGFKMRWCGLASWPSGHATEHIAQAKAAGQSLAKVIDRPFHLVPAPHTPANPLSETQPLQITARISPMQIKVPSAIPPESPPFEFEQWALVPIAQGYLWHQRSWWLVGTVMRGLGYIALVILFLLLGIGSQISGLAAVKPGWLPWIGISVAILLIGLTLRSFWQVLTASNVIIDSARREVRRQSRYTGLAHWRLPFHAVAYVLVSQTPAQPQGRDKRTENMRIAQDVWLHLYDGKRFWLIAALGRVEGESQAWEIIRRTQKKRGRRPLRLASYDTPAHHAALLVAHTLGCNVWLDVI